jgi:mono/diheme cytochrome c family protein
MRRWLPFMLALLLAITVACGDDGDDDDDDATDAPTATTASGGAAPTATEGEDDNGDDGEGDADAGQAIYQAQCATCHSVDGSTIVGPTWQGLYGSEITLEDGSTVTADDEYIRESILEPGAKIHADFQNAMPTFNGILSDEQIADVIAYIKTLE